LAQASASSIGTTRRVGDDPGPERLPRISAGQVRLILIFLVNRHVLQASVSSSNSLPNKTGVTRTTVNSVPHSVQIVGASVGGGNSCAATCFSSPEVARRSGAFTYRHNAGARR
jgi:hypothetical protein